MFMQFKKYVTEEDALKKIKHYCAYQERCHSEVKEKLYSFGLYKQQVENILSKLIEDNYLNEERFAIAFAGGKFRMKHWGRKKIEYELRQKQVSTFCIKLALKAIDEKDYHSSLLKLATAKWNSVCDEVVYARVAKTYAYLLQKGYESSLIQQQLKQIQNK